MKMVYIFILLFISQFTQAQQNSCELEKFRVVFVNGELMTPKAAFVARNELALSLGNLYKNEDIAYDLAYNYSDKAFEKLLQSSNPYHWYLDLAQQVYSWKYPIEAAKLTHHVEKYREAILHGQKVLLVAHSEGNFYANMAKQILKTQKPAIAIDSLGIFGIASPTSNIDGGEKSYLTNHLDIISIIPGNLPPNWTLHHISNRKVVNSIGSIPAHNFTNTYLSPYYDIRSEVIKGIKKSLSKLTQPPKIAKSGSFTVTMIWNLDKSDVDLHIFEPDNTHVFYKQQKGRSGYLDVDNTKEFGPEHYYSDCNKLQVGTYIIGVNYYQNHVDNLPREATVTVTISTPNSSRTFITKLANQLGNSGDIKPKKLAKVVVEQVSDLSNVNENRRLKYRIVPLQ
ncbi:MAG: hypothetical protein KAH84_10880 [Thiomargarita sp.]|nr:hypothetical protein [Thiomargarita sp.]